MKLYIKNMVCDRCIMVVGNTLKDLALQPEEIFLGEVTLPGDTLAVERLAEVKDRLERLGFELIGDRRAQIVEGVRTAVISLIHKEHDSSPVKHSEYLAAQIGLDYAYVSKIFSEEEQTTIEQYIILQKIEKVKELLTYGDLTLSEIAWQLSYSSVAALSAQFKKVMGITPSAYKGADEKGRITLDKIGR